MKTKEIIVEVPVEVSEDVSADDVRVIKEYLTNACTELNRYTEKSFVRLVALEAYHLLGFEVFDLNSWEQGRLTDPSSSVEFLTGLCRGALLVPNPGNKFLFTTELYNAVIRELKNLETYLESDSDDEFNDWVLG